MVVSAILTTALAPITGALFGASYGTAIRIGYEIIFPALFGKVKPNPDAKDVIQSLHQLFTATGGVSAMEFGIDQGITMAQKKTASPAVQHLIFTDLGITEEQLRLKEQQAGRGGGPGPETVDPITPSEEFPEVVAFKPGGDIGDFQGLGLNKIKDHFAKLTRFQFVESLRLMDDEATKLDNSGAKGGGATLRQYHTVMLLIFQQRFGKLDNTIISKPPPPDQPTTLDAIRRDFDAEFILLWNDWQFYQQKLTVFLGKNPTSSWTPTQKITLDQNISKYKSLTLDAHKKILNFLTISKNDPALRQLAIAKEKQMPGPL